MATLAANIKALSAQNGALPKDIQEACAEVLTAAENAGHHIPAISWFNPASTPEHHVPGFPGKGGVANDFMVYGDRALQDFIDTYMWTNRARLGICWIISRRRIRSTSPGHSGNWEHYSGSNPHIDHTHGNFGKLAGTSGYSKQVNLPYVPPPTPDAPYPTPTTKVVFVSKLKPGVKDSDSVWWMQTALAALGFYTKTPTGEYGTPTEASVAVFQKSIGDAADGKVGPLETAKLFELANLGVTITP